MIAEGPLSKGDFAGFNVHSKGTVHEMVSMFEKLDFLNSECEVSQVDVQEYIDADKGIVVSQTIAHEEDLINAVMNLSSKSKTFENESSGKEIVTEKNLMG